MRIKKARTIDDIVLNVTDYGVEALERYKMSLYDYRELERCYCQIKEIGRTKTINCTVKDIFENFGYEIKTHKDHVGWLIKRT